MKKVIFSLVVLSLLIPAPAFAEEATKEEVSAIFTNELPQVPGMPTHQTPEMPMTGAGRVGNPPQNQIVATNDGGVIVLAGVNLMKYDADLNLVKEARIKIPRALAGNKQAPVMEKVDEAIAAAIAESQGKLS